MPTKREKEFICLKLEELSNSWWGIKEGSVSWEVNVHDREFYSNLTSPYAQVESILVKWLMAIFPAESIL